MDDRQKIIEKRIKQKVWELLIKERQFKSEGDRYRHPIQVIFK